MSLRSHRDGSRAHLDVTSPFRAHRSAGPRVGSVAIASIALEEFDDSFQRLGREIVRSDRTRDRDRRTHLLEVRGTGLTVGKVSLEASSFASTERAFEVVADERDGVEARDVLR